MYFISKFQALRPSVPFLWSPAGQGTESTPIIGPRSLILWGQEGPPQVTKLSSSWLLSDNSWERWSHLEQTVWESPGQHFWKAVPLGADRLPELLQSQLRPPRLPRHVRQDGLTSLAALCPLCTVEEAAWERASSLLEWPCSVITKHLRCFGCNCNFSSHSGPAG